MIDWKFAVKRDLQEYNDKERSIKFIDEEIGEIEIALEGVGSAIGHGEPVTGSWETKDNKYVNLIVKKDELEKNREATARRHDRIKAALESIPEEERLLLDRMYINRIPIDEVCDLMHLETSQVYNLTNKALKHLTIVMYGDAVG